MKNEQIELVKKWLAGESVSRAELVANAADAVANYADVANYAADLAAEAAEAAADGDAPDAKYWVKRYDWWARFLHFDKELTK